MAIDDEYEVLSRLFWRVAQLYEELEEKHLKKGEGLPLTNADIRTVHVLGEARRERMTNLAKRLRLTVGTLTTTIDRLVQKGYVVRQRIDEDRRVVEIALSDKGKEAYDQIAEAKKITAHKIFSRLNDEDRTHLREMLKKLSGEID